MTAPPPPRLPRLPRRPSVGPPRRAALLLVVVAVVGLALVGLAWWELARPRYFLMIESSVELVAAPGPEHPVAGILLPAAAGGLLLGLVGGFGWSWFRRAPVRWLSPRVAAVAVTVVVLAGLVLTGLAVRAASEPLSFGWFAYTSESVVEVVPGTTDLALDVFLAATVGTLLLGLVAGLVLGRPRAPEEPAPSSVPDSEE